MRAVLVRGMGAVGPHGLGVRGLGDRPPAEVLRVPPDLPLKEGFRAAALRWLDASSLWFLSAAGQALREAQPEDVREAGTVTGLGWGSNPPVQTLLESVHREGFASMNPSLFSFSVGNAPAAQAGIHLGLKGPSVTVNGKEAAGLAAAVEACRLIDAGLTASCVAGAVDHLDPSAERVVTLYAAKRRPPLGEGAYAVFLGREGSGGRGFARITAWTSLTRPTDPFRYPEGCGILRDASDTLLGRAGWEPGSVDLLALPEDTPALGAESGALVKDRFPGASRLGFQSRLGLCGASWCGALQMAAEEMRRGRGRRALLAAVSTGGAAYALAVEGAP